MTPKRITLLAGAAALLVGLVAGPLLAQQAQESQPFFVGNRVGLPRMQLVHGEFKNLGCALAV